MTWYKSEYNRSANPAIPPIRSLGIPLPLSRSLPPSRLSVSVPVVALCSQG